jgi:hypothetical protein
MHLEVHLVDQGAFHLHPDPHVTHDKEQAHGEVQEGYEAHVQGQANGEVQQGHVL